MDYKISGNIVDVHTGEIFPGVLTIADGVISSVERNEVKYTNFIMPGLVDAHIHIESSMLVPSTFAGVAVKHGTVATVSDPHEIANVLGTAGVDYMIENGKSVLFKFFFGAPSCVPATTFETSGSMIDAETTGTLLKRPDIFYLSEMMNFPGVIHGDPQVHEKIAWATFTNKPVDGHAPGLRGEDLKTYVNSGISTDHECSSYEEAIEKIKLGMKILIREGSAAKNLNALKKLISEFPSEVMLCSDDLHPDDLARGHLNLLVKRLLAEKFDFFNILRAITVHPVTHYKLPVGLLRKGDRADFIVVDNLSDFNILGTYIDGEKVYDQKEVLLPFQEPVAINNFNVNPVEIADLNIPDQQKNVRCIVAKDGELVTDQKEISPERAGGMLISSTEKDFLKIAVLNRYDGKSKPVMGFIQGFGLKKGAFASSIAHDSHNIIAVGTNDQDLAAAINLVIKNKGAVVAVNQEEQRAMPLDVAGIMSSADAKTVAEGYEAVNKMVKKLGCPLKAPLMTLAFMALLVIPDLKIGDKGLFDVNKFNFTSLYVESKE
ncbi:MAG TPA: adenine deaminase [Bacteroidales bacterium]|nr:adenine deaminase [Bacteroidales bacterium]